LQIFRTISYIIQYFKLLAFRIDLHKYA
jgi:hypothetical protein